MSRLFILSFFIFGVGNLLISQTSSSLIVFEQTVFDFGDILEKDGVVSHTFIFKNSGETSVKIDDIVSGCGCTSHDFPNDRIDPGQCNQIIVNFNPRHRPGFFSKEIVIFFDNRTSFTRVWIKGNVIPQEHPVEEDFPYNFGEGLYLNLKVLAFGKVEIGKCRQIKLRYANDYDRPMMLSFFVDPNRENLTFINPGYIQPKQRGELVFSYFANRKFIGERLFYLYPVVNGLKLTQPIVVKINGTE